jgi:hypothetical protein
MAIDHVGKDLEGLGVSRRDLRCLLYLPQIYVGWASPRRDVPRLEALLEMTARRGRLHPDCLASARGWLFERPTRAQFQSAFALLRVLRRATPAPLIHSSDVLQAMLWAVRAAQPATEVASTAAEDELQRSDAWRALNELEAWLEVDTSHLWLDILYDDTEHASASTPPATSTPAPQADRNRAAFPTPVDDLDADDEHSALLLIREPARLRADPFPLARRIG